MNDAMYIAATGMQAQQTHVNVIANNVANVSTLGFKRSRVNFQDLVQRETPVNGRDGDDIRSPGLNPLGVTVGAIVKQFSAGDIRRTDNPMDIAIQGEGFLEVLQSSGDVAYVRGGSLNVNADGLLATAEGFVLKQRIQVPANTRTLTITEDGQVSAIDANGKDWQLGRLELVTFANPQGLAALGDSAYQATRAAGEPLTAVPGDAGAGRIAQGQLESSNVKLVDEMVQLMLAQRAYEMSVKVVQAADELAGMTNGLRK